MEKLLAVDSLLVALTIIATAVMSASGVIQAIRSQFDVFGAGVLALLTAVGGGTVRDLLLGATPVFWITDLIYILTIIPVSIVCVILAKNMRHGAGRRLRILNYFDAVGLALFTLIGVQKAIEYGVSPIIAIILGCVTGVTGGMLRDVLCNEPPAVMREGLYATFALLGGIIFLVLQTKLSVEISGVTAFSVIVFGRVMAINRDISLKPLGSD